MRKCIRTTCSGSLWFQHAALDRNNTRVLVEAARRPRERQMINCWWDAKCNCLKNEAKSAHKATLHLSEAELLYSSLEADQQPDPAGVEVLTASTSIDKCKETVRQWHKLKKDTSVRKLFTTHLKRNLRLKMTRRVMKEASQLHSFIPPWAQTIQKDSRLTGIQYKWKAINLIGQL